VTSKIAVTRPSLLPQNSDSVAAAEFDYTGIGVHWKPFSCGGAQAGAGGALAGQAASVVTQAIAAFERETFSAGSDRLCIAQLGYDGECRSDMPW